MYPARDIIRNRIEPRPFVGRQGFAGRHGKPGSSLGGRDKPGLVEGHKTVAGDIDEPGFAPRGQLSQAVALKPDQMLSCG